MMPPAARRFVLYPYAPWFFALAILVTIVGFSHSYFGRFGQVSIYHHIHGASAGGWMLLLILQPILYYRGYLKLHRRLGWIASFTLVPMLIVGGLKMMKAMFANAADYPPGLPYRLAYIDLYSLLFFVLTFVLAIRYGRNLHLHARYMVCTVLVVLPPAITRLLFLVPGFDTFNKTLNGSFVCVELVLLLLLLDDRRSGRIRKPYLVALALFALLHLTMNFAGDWTWWKQAMDRYAALPF